MKCKLFYFDQINGWTLPGANIGIEFYLKPDLSKLADVNVWADAACNL